MELGAAHADEIRAFAERFQREHGFTLDFDSTAIAAVAARAQREGMHVEAMCAKLFKDYPFGLKLVTRSTGETRFTLSAEAVANPDKFVSELVVNACRNEKPECRMPNETAIHSNSFVIDITPPTLPPMNRNHAAAMFIGVLVCIPLLALYHFGFFESTADWFAGLFSRGVHHACRAV
jgi:hypothetical protein